MDRLTSLLDKSLLQRVALEDGEPRVVMLETIREYALAKLAEDPAEVRTSYERMTGYVYAFLDNLKAPVVSAEATALGEVARELENVRAAWLWAAREGRKVLPLATLFAFFTNAGRYREGIQFFAETARLLGDHGDADMIGRLTSSLAWLHYKVGDTDAAMRAAERSVAVLRTRGRPVSLGTALEALAGVLYGTGDYRGAEANYTEALTLYKRSGALNRHALVVSNLGLVAAALGDYPKALELYRSVLDLTLPEKRAHAAAYALAYAGSAHRLLGDLEASSRVLTESYTLSRSLSDADAQMIAAYELGLTALSLGTAERAEALLNEALALALAADDAAHVARAHAGLAQAAVDTDQQKAASHLRQALVAVKDTGLVPDLLGCLLGVAELWLRLSRHDEACSLLLLIRDHPAVWAHDRRRAERLLGEAGTRPASAHKEADLSVLSERTLARLRELSDYAGFGYAGSVQLP